MYLYVCGPHSFTKLVYIASGAWLIGGGTGFAAAAAAAAALFSARRCAAFSFFSSAASSASKSAFSIAPPRSVNKNEKKKIINEFKTIKNHSTINIYIYIYNTIYIIYIINRIYIYIVHIIYAI